MKNQPFTLGEWIQLVERNTRAMLYLFGIVVIGCGFVGTAVGVGLRWEIHHETEPIYDAMIWKIDKDGDMPAYLRHRARLDSLQHATEPRVSAAGYPLMRKE